MRKPKSNKALLFVGVAALVLVGAGGLYFAMGQPKAPTEATAPAGVEDDHAGEEGGHAEGEAASAEEGFVLLTPDQLRATGIEVVAVSRGGGGETRLAGRVEAMVDARASVGATVGGRVERVLVAPGQTVRAGQALVSLVSGDAAALSADADAAQAAYVAAEQAHGRDEELANQGVVARREAEVSHAQALSAQAAARAARARVSAAGAPNSSGRLGVTSPISGVVTSVQVGPGGFVPQGGVVAEVTNPSRVELVFNAPPQLAAEARAGARMRVAGPNGEFDAIITGVAADAGQQNSGAAVIRARPEGASLPPAGSPVSGSLVTGGSDQGLSVPSEAIQTVDGKTVVFVQIEGGFRAVQVLAGRQAGGRTEIVNGLGGSERIAATNAFLLKAEMAKGEAEHGH
ncbi:MAG: efflux RND transporter periplasmic adaptor subunit [Brevundimonas sp.]|uniref:efflux RND transporter periplasmic adaptor subunit n=1 Tax=Brevundimonas sp. TaxID=1871086 RepID=UPI00258C60DA|nr:efflux RND transporter periplasmic adaptor subunit [Brevundimonas sp.]MCV0415235.1 efflux RND transporter periplasmic adaptor subunit [Brevundimonas sp.]